MNVELSMYQVLLFKFRRRLCKGSIRSVLSAKEKLHTNKEEVYQSEVTARDVLSTL